jgi:ADP-L-glycero-D-manno-heptose 6-epimerase
LQLFEQISAGQSARLFRSGRIDCPDGGQERDFVWVGDCVEVALWLADGCHPSGLYNVGSGRARSFTDLARAAFSTLGREPRLEFVPMPTELAAKYQYFTRADISKLGNAGWSGRPLSIEDGLRRYFEDFLSRPDPYR